MRGPKKLVTVASLALAPIVAGGVAGVTVTALPAAAAPAAASAHPATLTAHHTTAQTPDPGDSSTEAPDPGEQQTPEADNPGGHADTPGTNVDHQFSGVE
jgi:hypothetical protein